MCDAAALLSAGSSPSLASKDQIPPPPTPSTGIVAQRHHRTNTSSQNDHSAGSVSTSTANTCWKQSVPESGNMHGLPSETAAGSWSSQSHNGCTRCRQAGPDLEFDTPRDTGIQQHNGNHHDQHSTDSPQPADSSTNSTDRSHTDGSGERPVNGGGHECRGAALVGRVLKALLVAAAAVDTEALRSWNRVAEDESEANGSKLYQEESSDEGECGGLLTEKHNKWLAD